MSSYLWIFAIFDVGALVLVASELLAPASFARPSKRQLAPSVALPLLVVTYGLQLGLLWYAVHHQAIEPGETGMLPVPLLSGVVSHADGVVALLLACGAVQAYALWNVAKRAPSLGWITGAAVALALLSFCAPIMVSPDAYAYVSDASLGLRAYSPPVIPFTGEFAVIDRWWGTPAPPTPYGPLWIAAAWVATAAFPALLGKVLALRLLGIACVAALLAILRAFRLPMRIVALAALNPALYFQFVASAHNDLFGIVLVLAGGLYVQTRPFAAIALIAAGALVKLPFALFAAPLLAARGSVGWRIGAFATVVVVAAAITLFAGGSGFVRAQAPHLAWSGIASVTTIAVAIATLAALGVAFLGGRRLRSAVWLIPLVSAYTCAWYLAWALPYAVARRRIVAYLLIAYPMASILLEVKFMRPWTLFAVVPAVVAVQALAWRKR